MCWIGGLRRRATRYDGRRKVVAMRARAACTALALAVVCALCGCGGGPPGAASSAPPPSPTTAPTPRATHKPQPPGLGVGRAEAARFFQLLDFAFTRVMGDDGQEQLLGTVGDDLAVVRLIGPSEEITGAAVTIQVPALPDDSEAQRTIAYLMAVLTLVAEDWEDGIGWLNDHLADVGESRTVHRDLDVVLTVTPRDQVTTVEFTISAR